jgi:hypothetical protein
MKKKIPKPKPHESSGRIKPTSVHQEPLLFSFRFLELDKKEFLKPTESEYFYKFFERIKNLWSMRIGELINPFGNNKTLRFHKINWDGTSEIKGFDDRGITPDDKESAYQFSISANEHGRVHGFLRDNIFYIVWLDCNHKLYPSP